MTYAQRQTLTRAVLLGAAALAVVLAVFYLTGSPASVPIASTLLVAAETNRRVREAAAKATLTAPPAPQVERTPVEAAIQDNVDVAGWDELDRDEAKRLDKYT